MLLAGVRWPEAVDTSGDGTDMSGCGRRKMARVRVDSSVNFRGGCVYIGRGS